MRPKRAKSVIAVLTFAGVTLLPLASGTAMAQTKDAVPQSVGQNVLQNATVFGDTPPNTPVSVSVVLTARNQAMLQQYIAQTTMPGSPNYRKFLSTSQFANEYGQSPFVIQGMVRYFATFGIKSNVYADNLDINLTGTAGQFNKAFGIVLKDMQYLGRTFHGVKEAPRLPSYMASPVLAVLGLTNYGNFSTNITKAPASIIKKLPTTATSETSSAPPSGWQTPSTMEQQYNVTPLVKAGDVGQGQTLGIVTLASMNPADAYQYWQSYGIASNPNRISLVNVDGGAGVPSLASGSDETTLDVEQSGALAPGANIIVYQAPNTDYGFADAFAQAISDNKAGSLSVSWGESEDAVNYSIAQGQESPNYAQVFNELFQEAAAQGISTFAATGDFGAYQAYSDLGTTDLSIGNPADSPYVTAAGGTTLPTSSSNLLGQLGINIPQQRAWGWDYLFPLWQQFGATNEQTWAVANIGGSNGGYSTIFREPSYQFGVRGVNHYSAVQWFTPINNNTSWSFNPNPPVVQGENPGKRAIPDLSLNADPITGYTIYSSLFDNSSFNGPWAYAYGGTSFVAPQLNGIAALINEAVGGRVGFWNPQIYRFATTPNSPLTPLDATGATNDNLFYSGTANTLYNPATGLGTPDVAKLAADFKQSQRRGQFFGGH